jgi:mannitol-specific phosphotransferase system IIBC component
LSIFTNLINGKRDNGMKIVVICSFLVDVSVRSSILTMTVEKRKRKKKKEQRKKRKKRIKKTKNTADTDGT